MRIILKFFFCCFENANHIYYNMIMISLHLQISWHEVHVSNWFCEAFGNYR